MDMFEQNIWKAKKREFSVRWMCVCDMCVMYIMQGGCAECGVYSKQCKLTCKRTLCNVYKIQCTQQRTHFCTFLHCVNVTCVLRRHHVRRNKRAVAVLTHRTIDKNGYLDTHSTYVHAFRACCKHMSGVSHQLNWRSRASLSRWVCERPTFISRAKRTMHCAILCVICSFGCFCMKWLTMPMRPSSTQAIVVFIVNDRCARARVCVCKHCFNIYVFYVDVARYSHWNVRSVRFFFFLHSSALPPKLMRSSFTPGSVYFYNFFLVGRFMYNSIL